jgi:hypothetical protein
MSTTSQPATHGRIPASDTTDSGQERYLSYGLIRIGIGIGVCVGRQDRLRGYEAEFGVSTSFISTHIPALFAFSTVQMETLGTGVGF